MLTNISEMWWWLNSHPAFEDKNGISRFQCTFSIEIVKVNPETDSIDDERSKNTKVRVWLESGKWLYPEDCHEDGMAQHDYRLDCGGDTFEEALKELYKKVYAYYGGDYTQTKGWKRRQERLNARAEMVWEAMKAHEGPGDFIFPSLEEKP